MLRAMVGGGASTPRGCKSVCKGFPSHTMIVQILVVVIPIFPTEPSRGLPDIRGIFASGAAAGSGRCGAVVRPRDGLWEGISVNFETGIGL